VLVGFCKTNVAPSQVNLGKVGPHLKRKNKTKEKTQSLEGALSILQKQPTST
jgi:hypothetical protein